ncbi:MAG: hypothetical protein WCL27_11515 [Betaproteobacteria bacterium]
MTTAAEAEEARIISELETRLGIPQGLFHGLEDEDDWSFIIKIHTLLETALGYLITSTLQREELAEVIEKLNFEGKTGKLKFAENLGLLNPDSISYLRLINELRNRVAHRIEHVSFTFDAYLRELDDGSFTSFFKRGMGVQDIEPGLFIKNRESLTKYCLGILWQQAMSVMTGIYYHDQKAELERTQQELYKSFYATNSILGVGLGFGPLQRLQQLKMADALRDYKGPVGLLDYVPAVEAGTEDKGA